MASFKVLGLMALLAFSLHSVRSADMQQLLELDATTAVSDPILWKTWYAAQYANGAINGQQYLPMPGSALEYEVDNTTVLLGTSRYYSLIAAFADHDGSYTDLSNEEKVDVPFLTGFVEGAKASKNVVQTFMSYIEAGEFAFSESASQVMEGPPVNILCTGAGGGATFVPMCALWAAVTYPNAHVLAISFGGAWPGNNKFNWTFTQLVDQFYLWPANVSGYGEGTIERLKLTEVLDIVSGGTFDRLFSFSDDEVFDGIRDILKYATTVNIIDGNGDDLTGNNLPALDENDPSTQSGGNITIAGEEYSQEQMNTMIVDWKTVEGECPLVLCKTRTPSVMMALIYQEYDPANPDWRGPVPLPDYFNGTVTSFQADNDADGAVFWNETTETAYFIFRGSESNRDWAANANAVQVDYPTSQAYENIYDDPEVHMGFLRQFEALTDKAEKPADNMHLQMSRLLDGKTPKVVVCTGQSLGGALSTLCGPWAALKYPTSSVTVINEGSPKVGDEDYVTMFHQVLGRAYRVVNGMDQVPLLAPLPNYHHVGGGIWIDDGLFILQERPSIKMSDSNWVDHNYYTYSIMQTSINSSSVPDWVNDLSDEDYGEEGNVIVADNSAGRSASWQLLQVLLGLACLVAML